ncbi:hypothetical protein CLCR_10778 [Cladophialophora carrionii]|uniref:ABC transporter domain-containing protein n=1 Tax=Cladophialophora carrionii TaxID=86049 RepID=A0A1C1CYY1_9EURO|nr:hypothetical protein CLCR_10778 [Cladophialophora carrionii]
MLNTGLDPSCDASGHTTNASQEVEKGNELSHHLTNHTLTSFSWSDVGVTVKDRKTKKPIQILSSSYGCVQAGSVVALMGPIGSGKTTLLNIMMNGKMMDEAAIRRLSTYVEQEDAMIGILTARETVDFAARLSMNGNTSKKDRLFRVDELIEFFGLQRQADTIVGTPLRKGLSGGQKRRLSVASQLVTSPRLVFLDEPTSGLDSTASFECMKSSDRWPSNTT